MIRIGFARDNPTIKRDFMALMRNALTDTLREVAGAELVWPEPPEPAPEGERGVRPGRR
jgi:hypothetical protein